jgi:hypothetical protein
MLLSILTHSKSASRSDDDEEHSATAAERERDQAEPEPRTTCLNQSLETLCEVFPGGDIEEIRRLLATTEEESRLYVVTEMLLKQRTASSSSSAVAVRHGKVKLQPWEKFRTDEYQNTVKKAL